MVKNSIFLSHYTEKPHLEFEPIFTTPQLKIKYNTRIQDIFDIYMEYYHNTIPTALEEKIFLLIDETHYDKNWARFAKTLYDKTPNIFMIFTGSSALEPETNTDTKRK